MAIDTDPFLLPGSRPIRLVIDTDTYNEIDDQFAVAYALGTTAFDVQALYAAPFLNERSESAGDGMQKSFDELHAVLDARGGQRPPVFAGAPRFMEDGEAVPSEATRDLIERAGAASPEDPLYLVAIGAPTNVASALRIAPDIAANLRIVWLGGHSFDWRVNDEFNLKQDLTASREILATDAPLLVLPCVGVTSHLTVSLAELEQVLDRDSAIGQLLLDRLREAVDGRPIQARVLWDVAAVAALRNPEWVPSRRVPRPGLADDLSWLPGGDTDPEIWVAYYVHRNPVIADLITALGTAS